MQCTILPPQDLIYIPVLPIHVGKTAVCTVSHVGNRLPGKAIPPHWEWMCTDGRHNSPRNASWLWPRYTIFSRHIWYSTSLRGVPSCFVRYVQTFYKKKLQSSEVCHLTEAKLNEMLAVVHKYEGTMLCRVEFVENSELWQLTKLMLNNLWETVWNAAE
jgi:hypothetical protein